MYASGYRLASATLTSRAAPQYANGRAGFMMPAVSRFWRMNQRLGSTHRRQHASKCGEAAGARPHHVCATPPWQRQPRVVLRRTSVSYLPYTTCANEARSEATDMSTMITFAANNEFFRKRKSAYRPCAAAQCATQQAEANDPNRSPPRLRIMQEEKSRS